MKSRTVAGLCVLVATIVILQAVFTGSQLSIMHLRPELKLPQVAHTRLRAEKLGSNAELREAKLRTENLQLRAAHEQLQSRLQSRLDQQIPGLQLFAPTVESSSIIETPLLVPESAGIGKPHADCEVAPDLERRALLRFFDEPATPLACATSVCRAAERSANVEFDVQSKDAEVRVDAMLMPMPMRVLVVMLPLVL